MDDKGLENVQKSFSQQARNFETKTMYFSKQDYLDFIVKSIELKGTEEVLEAAAGTCVCGRTIAPHVAKVTCLDMTPAMMDVGRKAAKEKGLTNISFVPGFVEKMPFPDNTFDVVITRLSFHHFSEMEKPFSEMYRVLKKGGKLVIIDMEAASEELRDIEDRIEILRDFSHVRNRSKKEFEELFAKYHVEIIRRGSTLFPVGLTPWMNLTDTPEEKRKEIVSLMEEELAGGKKTGFAPYRENGEIRFPQRWLFFMGIK